MYAEFGWEYTDEYDAILKAHLEADQKKRAKLKGTAKKMHSYSLDQYVGWSWWWGFWPTTHRRRLHGVGGWQGWTTTDDDYVGWW